MHGGGPEINIWLNKLGIEAQFKDGLRVTDGRHSAIALQSAIELYQHLLAYQWQLLHGKSDVPFISASP